MPEASPLGPIDPASITDDGQQVAETEKTAPWAVRKLADSMTGRVVLASYESMRSTGTSVVCLSPWGDSNPILLPCVRFRDLVMHAVVAGTGGAAAVAAPAIGPVSDAVVDTFGDSLLVDIGLSAGFSGVTNIANDLIIDESIERITPGPSKRLETTGIKRMLVTLKYKHRLADAQLGFFRSSVHRDTNLFADVKDYLAVEKGWFNPYLFASGRRPIIPRSMTPDVIFCHGPFLGGDYRIGNLLLRESESAIFLCEASRDDTTQNQPPDGESGEKRKDRLRISSLSKFLPHKRSHSPMSSSLATVSAEEATVTAVPAPAQPRRLVALVLGLAPHRAGLWTSSARPDESALHYTLLNGCPAIVLPARPGAPLIAWDTLTLKQMHKLRGELPSGADTTVNGRRDIHGGEQFQKAINVLYEYMDLCIDWERVRLEDVKDVKCEEAGKGSGKNRLKSEEMKKDAVRDALNLLLIAAICSGESKEVQKEVDAGRAGIVIYRVP